MKVSHITIKCKSYNIKAIEEDYGEVFFSNDVIGIKVFLTHEEAEKKLEEMKKMLRITLDEAIVYEEEIVERARRAMNFESVDSIDNDIKSNCKMIEMQHWQLIKWLKELKLYREAEEKGLIKVNSTIDKFIYCPYCGRKLKRSEKNNE